MSKFAKAVLISLVGVALASSGALADHIGVYGDAAGATCTLALVAPFEPINTYVIHKFTTGTTGSQWKIVDTSTLFQAGTASPYAVLGGAYTGASVAYGGCLVGQVNAMTLTHLWFGQAVVCGKMEVVSDPLAPYIQVTDCQFAAKQATGGQFFFNPNGTCTDCRELATETTTWGTIKALYR